MSLISRLKSRTHQYPKQRDIFLAENQILPVCFRFQQNTLHKKMKFSIKDFFSKCNQIRGKLNAKRHFLCSGCFFLSSLSRTPRISRQKDSSENFFYRNYQQVSNFLDLIAEIKQFCIHTSLYTEYFVV